MAFVIDDRNLGGRKFIYHQHNNHKRAMLNVKPTMNLKVPPKAHVD